MLLEEIRRSAIGELRGVSVEVDAAMSGKGVATTGVGEDFSEFVAGERGNDLSLRVLRDIFVLFAQMHHQADS